MPELLLGVDVGTSSSKAALTDPAGSVISSVVTSHETSNPRPGWFEHDADRIWWGDSLELIRRVQVEAGVTGDDIAGIAVSAIGPCLLPLDEKDRPLRPGILYGIDTRASQHVEAITQAIGAAEVRHFFGMDLTSQAVGPKMAWLETEEPDIWTATRRVTTASSYVVLKLTGEHVIDRHTAAHFMPFFDTHNMEWTDRYETAVDGLELLPRLAWATAPAGVVTKEAGRVTGLRPGTPVAVGTVDAAAEGLSVGVHRPGDLMIMYGSTMFFILVTEKRTPVTGAWLVGGLEKGLYNVAAGMATSGLLTEWVAKLTSEGQSGAETLAHLFDAAAATPPGAEGLLMLPYFEGERTPINDPRATGVIVGLGLRHDQRHLMRAALEGVAYGARQNVEAILTSGAKIDRIVAVGGGTKDRIWTQIVSDVGGFSQELPAQRFGASYGDAFIAGVASGILDAQHIDEWVAIDAVIEPDQELRTLYDDGNRRFRSLYEQTRSLQHELRAQREGSGNGRAKIEV